MVEADSGSANPKPDSQLQRAVELRLQLVDAFADGKMDRLRRVTQQILRLPMDQQLLADTGLGYVLNEHDLRKSLDNTMQQQVETMLRT